MYLCKNINQAIRERLSMKRVLFLLMCILIVMISVTACNSEDAGNPSVSISSSQDIKLSGDVNSYPKAKDSYNIYEIKEAFQYGSEQPKDMSTLLMRDMDELRKKVGINDSIYISDELAYSEYKCDNGGSLYVVFCDMPEEYDYFPIELVAFTMKDLCFDDFDRVQIGTTTIDDVEAIDPAVKVTYINYGEEKYTTHFTKDGIVKFNYTDGDEGTIVNSIEVLHQSVVKNLIETINK